MKANKILDHGDLSLENEIADKLTFWVRPVAVVKQV